MGASYNGGAMCFIRTDTASSGTGASDSHAAGSDLLALLRCVFVASLQLTKWKKMGIHIMVRFSGCVAAYASLHVCAGNIYNSGRSGAN